MPISDLTDHQLDRFEANYRQKNKTEGGIYSLSEIMLEKRRRKPSEFGVREVAAKIIELAAASEDGLVTYSDLWSAFRGDPWTGHKSLKIISNSLDRVIYYCVTNRLPILTVLVVQKHTRALSRKAVEGIYESCRDLGVDVGLDPTAFVEQEIKRSAPSSFKIYLTDSATA
jgi:hypothetical protein